MEGSILHGRECDVRESGGRRVMRAAPLDCALRDGEYSLYCQIALEILPEI